MGSTSCWTSRRTSPRTLRVTITRILRIHSKSICGNYTPARRTQTSSARRRRGARPKHSNGQRHCSTLLGRSSGLRRRTNDRPKRGSMRTARPARRAWLRSPQIEQVSEASGKSRRSRCARMHLKSGCKVERSGRCSENMTTDWGSS